MKRKRDPYPIFTLCELKDHIDTNPDYQRPSVWPLSNKQLLISLLFYPQILLINIYFEEV